MISTGITTLVICAIIVQFLVERVKPLIFVQWRKWVVPLISMAAGIAVAYFTQTGLFEVIGLPLSNEYADYIFTGFAYSGGSGAVNELIKMVMENRPSNKANDKEI